MAVALYEPGEADVFPNAKRLAGRFAQALATYDDQAQPREVVGDAAVRRTATLDLRAIAASARPLFERGVRSAGEVVYAQLGGLQPHGASPTTASVMVVLRQRILTGSGNQRITTRTLDVRLRDPGNGWRLDGLASIGGEPVRRPRRLSRAARRVLADERIALPHSAQWDIHRGDIDERLLRTMIAMADVAPFAVTVLKSGHPDNVFGTDTPSHHTGGRGVDVWAVDGIPVVEQHEPGSAAHRLMTVLLGDEAIAELGSPWDLDGSPPPSTRSFTDPVHADHLHVAYRPPV